MDHSAEIIGLVYHPDYLIHTQADHPERKERLEHILETLSNQKLEKRLQFIEPFYATVEQVARVHDPIHIRSVDEACRRGRNYLDMDTYIVPRSYEIALLAAGGALKGLQVIMEGDLNRVFALVRPPGHHAERDRAMGFCLFNNIAVAAQTARQEYGLERVAIVDWDVHHGNGTAQIFAQDPAVLFISTHQSPAYPGTGHFRDAGRGAGAGFTVNIPLPSGSGDADYLLFVDRVIVPILNSYKPEILMISAGQDAYYKDPLAGMELTAHGFYRIAEALAQIADRWCKGRILLCLEGGYHLQGQAGLVLQILNAVGRWSLPVPEQSPVDRPSAAVSIRLEEVINVQKNYWPLD